MRRENMGNVDWQNLPLYWQQVDELVTRLEDLWDKPRDPHALTAKSFDEAQTAGTRTYIEAQRALGVAIDNHEALLALLKANGATVWAPWSLIRPMFESSFFAAWLLDPSDGLERRQRGLRLEVQDARQQRLYLECFQHLPSMRKDIKAQLKANAEGSGEVYKQEASALGMVWDHMQKDVSVFDNLPKLAFIKPLGPDAMAFLQSTWRMLSGFEHGLTYAAMRGSDMSVKAPTPGGQMVQLTVNDEALVTALKSSYMLLLEAGRLYERRATRPD